MTIFNALLNLSELKELYSGKPVCVCPLYNGVLNATKTFEATGNPIVLPEYKSLVKLKTTFSPKQAGTGNPSPENVRPISGWDSIKLTVSNESESHDYNITLPETVYGGTVDAVTGVGSKEWAVVTLNSEFLTTNEWVYNAPGIQTTPVLYGKIPLAFTNVGDIYCTHFKRAISAPINNLEYWSKNAYFGNTRIAIRNDVWTDLESAITWLDAQESAGTPVQVAYKLATPEPFEISQTSIPSLSGENTLFTNGDSMDIIYKTTSFWGRGDEA